MRRANETSEDMMDFIAQALVKLMAKQPYEKITVRAIVQRAGVNRATYYRHFTSKEDVIRYYLSGIMAEYLERFGQLCTDDYRLYLLVMFETFARHRDALLAIHSCGQSWMLRSVLEDAFSFDRLVASASEAQQFKASYHIGGIFNNLMLWLDRDMQETPEDMTRIALSFKPAAAMMLVNAGSRFEAKG